MTTTLSTQILFIGLAVLIGLGHSLQVSMVSAMGRMRGPLEATWVSMLASVLGMAILLGWQALQQRGLHLPVPFERWWVFTIAGVLFAVSLALAARGIAPYFALTRTTSHSLRNRSRISRAAAWGRPVLQRGHRRTDDWLPTARPRRSIWPRCSESHCISSTRSRTADRRGQPHSLGSVMHQTLQEKDTQ